VGANLDKLIRAEGDAPFARQPSATLLLLLLLPPLLLLLLAAAAEQRVAHQPAAWWREVGDSLPNKAGSLGRLAQIWPPDRQVCRQSACPPARELASERG